MTVNGHKILSLGISTDKHCSVKSNALWGHIDSDRSTIVPLIYLKRPNWIPKKDFDELCQRIMIKDDE